MQLILLESVSKYFLAQGSTIQRPAICDANPLTGFCMDSSFTGKCYRTNHNLFLFTCLMFLCMTLLCVADHL